MTKQWVPPKRKTEYIDTARMKKVKITAETLKTKGEKHG